MARTFQILQELMNPLRLRTAKPAHMNGLLKKRRTSPKDILPRWKGPLEPFESSVTVFIIGVLREYRQDESIERVSRFSLFGDTK
jgi:hypothetical protein